jgi:hypothetical protein
MGNWMGNSSPGRSRCGEQIPMGLDVAGQHLKLDVPLVVGPKDLGDRRVSVAATHHDMAPSDRHEASRASARRARTRRPSRMSMKPMEMS